LDETHWVSCLRENFTSSSYGEGLETGDVSTAPVPYPTAVVREFDMVHSFGCYGISRLSCAELPVGAEIG
jgi:hypothetical protein